MTIRPALIGLALLAAAAACSSSGRSDAAMEDASASDVVADTAPDLEVISATCQQIRQCVFGGGGLDACMARGTHDAQVVFMSLMACLAAPCPDNVISCVCRETCDADGYCLDQTDACLSSSGATIDAVCDNNCR